MIASSKINSQKSNLNLYNALKDLFFNKEDVSLNNFSENFIGDLFIHCKEENFSLNILHMEDKYFFSGYPFGNYLKSISRVMELWADAGHFPISYTTMVNLHVRHFNY